MHRGIVAAAMAVAGIAPGFVPAPALAEQDGPSVSLTKTVYAGHDGGARCAEAETFAEAGQGDPVTYCLTVTNTGSTFLASVVVSDPLAANAPVLLSADSTPLAPGASARFYLDSVPPADEADGAIDETFVNTASASALPVGDDGTPVQGAVPVMATAEAIVYPPAEVPAPAVTLATSVYAGHDGGHGCPAADETVVRQGDPITYCYTVTNTGTTHLADVAFADLGVDATPTLIGEGGLPMGPGASLRYFLEATAPELPAEGYAPKPAVTASAVDETGAALAGVEAATGADSTLVRALAVAVAADPVAPAQPATPTKPLVQKKPAVQPTAITTTAPHQLAYTGWETWLVATAGIGLAALGWLLVNAARERDRLTPIPVPVRPTGRASTDPERSA